MSTWRYGKLLSLKVKHSYYRDQDFGDWELIPSNATKAILSSHKMMWKNQSNEEKTAAIIAGELADTNLKYPLATSAKLDIYLKLKRSAFQNYTDPQMVPGGNEVLLFGNRLAQGAGLATGMKKLGLYGPRITRSAPPSLTDGMVVSLCDLNDQELKNATVENGSYRFMLEGGQKGEFLLKYPIASGIDPISIYVDAEAIQRGVGGIILLENDYANGITNVEFELLFRTKSKPWTYIIALAPTSEGLTCEVNDLRGIAFSEVNIFDLIDADLVRYVTALEQQVPDGKVFVFQSESNIDWQEGTRSGIQLNQTDTVSPILLEADLPSPFQNDFVVINKRISEFQL